VSRRYNFTQCVTQLHTNFKTFKHWLVEDGIDAGKQLNRADSREKYLTEEQLVAMAQKRDIPLHLPDPERKPESSAARILAGVDERFAALEQQMAGRIDQLAADIPTMLADLRHTLEQQLTHHFDQFDARLEGLLAELQRTRESAPPQERPLAPAPRARNAAPSASTSTLTTPTTAPPKPTAKKRGKRTAKAKQLPKNFVPLSVFKNDHNVSAKAVEYAMERGKLATERGKWLYNGRNVLIALDRQGQQQFHALFNGRDGFQLCKGCPHAL
jgi:hypothetical protein